MSRTSAGPTSSHSLWARGDLMALGKVTRSDPLSGQVVTIAEGERDRGGALSDDADER